VHAVKKSGAYWATGIVVVHLLVNIVHGSAHGKLGITLGPMGTLFVVSVVLVCPLLAAGLLWTAKRRFGFWLLAVSMAGSFIFGLYNHFVAMGPDRVGAQSPGKGAGTFAATAYLLLVSEAVGSYVAIHFLYHDRDAHDIVRSRSSR
jgi:hypothetical protein